MLNWESEMSADSGWVSGGRTAEGGGGHTEELVGVDALQDFDFLDLLFGRHGQRVWCVSVSVLYCICLCIVSVPVLYCIVSVSLYCICTVSYLSVSLSSGRGLVFGGVVSCGADLGWFGLDHRGE